MEWRSREEVLGSQSVIDGLVAANADYCPLMAGAILDFFADCLDDAIVMDAVPTVVCGSTRRGAAYDEAFPRFTYRP